jgi:hypothetical protein
MGPELPRLYRAAGLTDVGLSLYAPMGGPADWAGYDWVVDAARSLLPLLEQYGIATAEEVGLDTLGARLRADVEARAPAMLPPHVGAWARVPAART